MKTIVNWLQEGDRNTRYFYVVTAERRKRNRMVSLIGENGHEWRSDENIAGEIASCSENLFTTS